ARSTSQMHKLAVYHMDYEAQYEMTTEYVQRTFNSLPDGVKKYWFCVPIKAQCATSMYQNYWQPWKPEDHEIWCRPLPVGVYHAGNWPFDFGYDCSDYEFNLRFAKW